MCYPGWLNSLHSHICACCTAQGRCEGNMALIWLTCLQADADRAFAIPADQLLKVELPFTL